MEKASVALELMFPAHCLFCGEVKPFRQECPDCAQFENKHRLTGERRFNYQFLTKSTKNLSATISSYIYTDEVADLIARYKFRRHYSMARDMAKIMAADILELLGSDCCDLVLPVPSHKNGTNQHSALLAKRVAKILEKEYSDRALLKTEATKPQHQLSFAERAENLKGVFSIPNPGEVLGRHILLCDDVITSGNTLNECAAVLLKAGAEEVLALTFAATSVSRASAADKSPADADVTEIKKDAGKKGKDSKKPKKSRAATKPGRRAKKGEKHKPDKGKAVKADGPAG